MKYIGPILCLWGLALTGVQARAQGQSYVAPSLTLSSPSVNAAVETSDPTSIITIQKRVDEVNVLFIAMDKHGKFVRDLQKDDFNVLDDHKHQQSIVRLAQMTN